MSLIVVIFMFYINSFLIKTAKRNSAFTAYWGWKTPCGPCYFLGKLPGYHRCICCMLAGTVFGRLELAAAVCVKNSSSSSIFKLPAEAFSYTSLLFGIIFVLITLYNQFQVRLANLLTC